MSTERHNMAEKLNLTPTEFRTCVTAVVTEDPRYKELNPNDKLAILAGLGAYRKDGSSSARDRAMEATYNKAASMEHSTGLSRKTLRTTCRPHIEDAFTRVHADIYSPSMDEEENEDGHWPCAEEREAEEDEADAASDKEQPAEQEVVVDLAVARQRRASSKVGDAKAPLISPLTVFGHRGATAS